MDTARAARQLYRRGAGRRSVRGGLYRRRHRAHAAAAGPQPCAAVRQAASTPAGQGAHTNDQVASAYDFSSVYAAGDEGAGVTVAVYELEPNDPGDIAAYQACYGTHASISYIPVDGGAGSGPGAGEAALDIENLIGFAPDVHVLVYQGPNSNSGAPGSGPYDTFKAIITQDRARVVTQLKQGAAKTLQPGPACRIAWRDSIGTAKPRYRFPGCAKVQLVETHLETHQQDQHY